MSGYRTVLEHLFAQMDALEAIDPKDAERLAAEIERGKSLIGMANTVVNVSKEIRAANEMQMRLGENAALKALGGGGK